MKVSPQRDEASGPHHAARHSVGGDAYSSEESVSLSSEVIELSPRLASIANLNPPIVGWVRGGRGIPRRSPLYTQSAGESSIRSGGRNTRVPYGEGEGGMVLSHRHESVKDRLSCVSPRLASGGASVGVVAPTIYRRGLPYINLSAIGTFISVWPLGWNTRPCGWKSHRLLNGRRIRGDPYNGV